MPTVATYSEQELVSLLKQKNREAFNYLYKNYSATLYGIIRRIIPDEQTSSDVLQDAFVKIWNNIEQYNPEKGRIYTWMLNIARNAAIDRLRSKGEVMKSKIRNNEDIVNSFEGSMKTEQNTDIIGLRNIITGLKTEYQVIIDYAYFKGFTLDEIAKTLDIPLGTVKTRMRQAMQLLRKHFSKN